MHDFKVVAVLNAYLAQSGAGNDLKVALDRDAQRIKAKAVDHLGNTDPIRHSPVLAVHSNSKASVQAHAPRQ